MLRATLRTSEQIAQAELTGVRHQLHPVAHHTHFVQTRLAIKQHEANDSE